MLHLYFDYPYTFSTHCIIVSEGNKVFVVVVRSVVEWRLLK